MSGVPLIVDFALCFLYEDVNKENRVISGIRVIYSGALKCFAENIFFFLLAFGVKLDCYVSIIFVRGSIIRIVTEFTAPAIERNC